MSPKEAAEALRVKMRREREALDAVPRDAMSVVAAWMRRAMPGDAYGVRAVLFDAPRLKDAVGDPSYFHFPHIDACGARFLVAPKDGDVFLTRIDDA